MELDDSFRLTFRHWRMITAIACLGLIVGLGVQWLTPLTYDAAVNLMVERVNQESTADYQYDGYYAQQAADDLAQTVVSWLGTPSVLVEIYSAAGLDASFRSLDEASRRFQAKKYSNQNVGIRINERSSDTAEKLAVAAADTIKGRVSETNKTAGGQPMFKVVTGAVVVVARQSDWLTLGGLGLIAGGLAGWALAFSLEVVKGQGRGESA